MDYVIRQHEKRDAYAIATKNDDVALLFSRPSNQPMRAFSKPIFYISHPNIENSIYF
jgi:hypothetical protein